MGRPRSTRAQGLFALDQTGTVPLVQTKWVLAAGDSVVRMVRQVIGSTNSPATTAQLRFASVRKSAPGAWTTLSNSMSGDGWQTDNADISTTTDQLWVQAGLFGTGATSYPAGGGLELEAWVQGAGRIVASRTIQMVPTVGTTYTEVPLGGLLPMAGMSKVMYTVSYAHEGGSTYIIPVYRTIANDRDIVGSWTYVLGSNPGAWSADTDWNSGLTTLSDDTSKSVWQAGIKYKNINYGGTLRVTVVALW